MGQKILICDDNEGSRESLKLILGNNFDLILVDSQEQAVKTLARSTDIRLFFLRISLLNTTGMNIFSEMKTKNPQLPIILLGNKSGKDAVQAATLNIHEYLEKPFKSDQVLTVAKKHLIK